MATTENNKYVYNAEEYGKNSFDILLGPPTREDIRVGYIDSRQGYVTGRSICDANRHAKLNPGAQFIIKTRKRVRYLNVNEVNTITPEQAFDTSEEGMGIPKDKCKVEFGSVPEKPRVDFMGGGGVGVKGNPVIGRDGSVLAVHIVDGGFGYKYAPLVDVKDPSQIGGGVVAESFLGEISAGLETYNDESDIEEYFPTNAIDPKTGQPSGVNIKSFCDSKVNTDVSYGRVYSADGLDVAEWDPTLYSNFGIDPFRKRVEDYQAFLAQLKTPWWVSRRRGDVNTPLSVSASWDKTIPEYFYETRPGYTKGTTVYPVQHSKWGGYYKKDLEGTQQGGLATGSGSTNTDLEDIEFKFFVAVAKSKATGFRWVFRELKEEPNPKKPIYKGEDRYGPHRFIVSPDDMKSSTGGKSDLLSKNIDTIVKKVKVNTTYQIIGEGTTSGYGVEQGLVSKMRGSGTGLSGGHNTEIVGEDQTGTMIFSDLIYSENDDDDMQLGATAGLFTQKNRRPGAKGNKLPSTEMYEVNGKRVTTGIKEAISGGMGDIAYTTTKKVLDENGEWKDETTTIKEFGRDTYDLFYRVTPQELGLSKGNTKVPEDATGGKGEATAITQSFMNKYAISPIPPSNDRGSDYADQLFIMQWDQVFPYGGEYHFRGQTDNHCKFYLDNEFISDLSSFQNTPWEWKKEFSWKGSDDGQATVKNIRLELRNDSDLESIIVQQDDGDWILPGDDPGDYIDVPFDVFVHVGKKWENWENVKTPETTGGLVRVCFNSVGKNATGSGKVKVRMTSSGRYGGPGQRCAHGVQFGDLFKVFSISSDEGWGGGHTVEYGKDYEVTIVSDGSLGPHATDDSGGRCPDSTIKLTIENGQYGRSKKLVIGTNNSAYNNASDMEVDGGYFHSVDGNKVKYKAGPKEGEGGSVEKFIITPLDVKKKEKVTFTVSSNADDNNTFVLRAPGEPFAFSIARRGTKTVSIPFGRKDEVHILGHQGKIKFADNWRTIYFEDRPGGTDFDDLIVTCSTGRFFSQGRKLNTEYSYKYPNFIPTIDWGHDADVEGQIVLTETDNWCGELKSGVDYGVRFETNSTGGGKHGGNILDGKTTGQKFAFSVGSITGPFDDLVVTCDKGRFRSKDGSDDWGYFGHFGQGPGGSIGTVDQMLWSMPKQTNTSSKKTPDSPTGLQFTFLSADKSHKFTIRSNEIKNDKGDQKWGKGLRWTSGVQQVVRRVKVNTKYKVWASINNPLHGEEITQCEQGLIENMGRRPNEEPFAKANSTGKYIMADIIGTDNDDDDMQLGATKGTFGSSNRHRHGYSPGGSKGRWTWDLSYEVTKKIKDNQDLKGSTNSKIQTKEIFTTTGSKWITPTSSPNGQMWRINEVGDADSKSGFLNEYGVTPFNPREEVPGEAYSGTHKIVWNNVDFPMNGDYNIKVDVDDSVELVFEGPDGINVINKNGFINGKSTGSSFYREFFNKGSYKITANLTQTEGGTYSFKPLTQEQMEAARLEEFQRTQVEKPVMTSVTFNQGSEAGCTNHSAITGLFKITRNGSATKDVEIGKQYNVAISSDCGNGRVKLKITNNGRTLKMEDWDDNDYNDLVLTCSGGKFHSLNGRFCQYEGGPNVGSADEAQLEAWEANSTRSINDIALKGANPMSLAVKVSLSFVEAQKMKPQSWYQNPMGVAFTIEAPLAKPPVQKKPISEGRCPNNPFWTTRFADDADKVWYPVRNNKKEKNGETMWSEFMNKYAMSPLPPLNWTGTDFGGQWFTNEWNVNIPYDGWYIFKMLADDDARFYIKGSQKPEYGDPSLAISRYKGDPKQVRIKLFEGQGKFRVDVKNRNTTEYDHIEKKIFSARDWVGEPGASDATWEGVADPTRFKDVDFEVFAHVLRRFVFGKKIKASNTVCFRSTAGKNATGSGKVKVRMTSSGRYNGTPNRCAHGVQFGDLFKVFSISSDEGWGGGHTVEYGKDYTVTIVSDGSLGPHATDDSGGRCPDSTIKLSIVDGEYGRSRRLVIGTTNNAYNNASAIEVDGGYFHSVDGNKVKYKAGPKEGDVTNKFIITPLNAKKEKVTFNVSSNADDNNTFVLRAPGQPFAFSISRRGTKTVSIPFGRKDEVHILGHQGKIRFTNNWKTINFEDRPGGSDFDDLIVTCSTGRFFSDGRKLNTDYSYKYPNFIPTIDWGHDVDAEQVIVLTNTDEKCVELKSGVDYGVRFETNSTGGGRHGGNILDGKTTGQKFAFSVGSITGPFDDMVVTCDKGRFRSKDGSDDWGYFGHFGQGPGGSIGTVDQMLWSMSKNDIDSKDDPNWNPDINGLRCTFAAKDGSHRFTINPTEVTEKKGKKSMFFSSGIQKVKKKVKLNTVYNVLFSVNKAEWQENLDRCEQGFVSKLGRGKFAVEQQKWEDGIPNGGKNQYIFGEVIDTAEDGDDLQIGAVEGTFKHWNKRRHSYSPGGKLGHWTYDLTYEIPWDPPPVVAENVTHSGTIKEGVRYDGPFLMHYLERDWGPYMNKMNVAPIVKKDLNLALYNDDILGTKIMTWTGVKFDHPGDYDVRFIADNIGRFYVNDEKLLDATNNFNGDRNSSHSKVSIANSGPQTIRVELDNSDGSNIFYDNPTGMVLEITKPLALARHGPDGRVLSDSWVDNPTAVSMECIPPPCSKIREGKGVVTDVRIIDPGNGFPKVRDPEDSITYPVESKITGFNILNPGINYGPGDLLKVEIPDADPVLYNLKLTPFGGISTVFPPGPGDVPGDPTPPPPPDPTVTEWPDITIIPGPLPGTPPGPPGTPPGTPPGLPPGTSPGPPPGTPPGPAAAPGGPPAAGTPTGVNAHIVPIIESQVLLPDGIDPRTGLPVPPAQIIQVTDLAGIKRTGFYNGKPYYGAVFYKEGVRYAGYYETAGVLIQIYSTLQESIDATVTTPPSAIQRQGTDISSNDPRLDIPGTPQ